MAFGQQQGFPATHRQVSRLVELLAEAGHEGFRDARGPLGLTQRQAAGKFTRDEADSLIARLEHELDGSDDGRDSANGGSRQTDVTAGGGLPRPVVDRRQERHSSVLKKIPTDVLAAELQQRGWIVIEP